MFNFFLNIFHVWLSCNLSDKVVEIEAVSLKCCCMCNKLFLENNLELSELLINGTRMQEIIKYQLGFNQNHILKYICLISLSSFVLILSK